MEDKPKTVRERIEETQRAILCPQAALAAESRGRDRPDELCPFRTIFQQDRDRILHSKAFRRLKHKTQVFLSPFGDHYRTRLTHTLEVAQIARTISRALRLNEDLTEAIALGHDLGHTPFGHAGERALNQLMEDGFRHYEQSVRVVEQLENDGRGLNLTREVRNGILRHTSDPPADTLEGRVVRLADRIAYLNHDLDDAVRAGVMQETDIPVHIRRHLGERRTERIDALVAAVAENSGAADGSVRDIRLDDATAAVFEEMHSFMYSALYSNPLAKSEETMPRLGTVLYNHCGQAVRALQRSSRGHSDGIHGHYGERGGCPRRRRPHCRHDRQLRRLHLSGSVHPQGMVAIKTLFL
jgi:dGTPase